MYHSKGWKLQTRPAILRRDPLCQLGILCEGRAPSTDVDHIIRADVYIAQHGGAEWAFYDESNLRGACARCHSHRTALDRQGLWTEPKGGYLDV